MFLSLSVWSKYPQIPFRIHLLTLCLQIDAVYGCWYCFFSLLFSSSSWISTSFSFKRAKQQFQFRWCEIGENCFKAILICFFLHRFHCIFSKCTFRSSVVSDNDFEIHHVNFVGDRKRNWTSSLFKFYIEITL